MLRWIMPLLVTVFAVGTAAADEPVTTKPTDGPAATKPANSPKPSKVTAKSWRPTPTTPLPYAISAGFTWPRDNWTRPWLLARH